MNLNAYDNVKEKIDKTKTWIDVKHKCLISKEIKYRKYICLLKRYNPETCSNNYYIALLDNPIENKNCYYTNKDDYGRIKYKLSSIWYETCLSHIERNCNICINLVERDSDGEVYLIDI